MNIKIFPTKDMQTPLRSGQFLLKMRNVLNRMKNEIKIFAIFVFQVMGENSSKIDHILSPKMTITQKIEIWKIWNRIFLSIQLIPHHSCKFDHFWKKKDYDVCANFLSCFPCMQTLRRLIEGHWKVIYIMYVYSYKYVHRMYRFFYNSSFLFKHVTFKL